MNSKIYLEILNELIGGEFDDWKFLAKEFKKFGLNFWDLRCYKESFTDFNSLLYCLYDRVCFNFTDRLLGTFDILTEDPNTLNECIIPFEEQPIIDKLSNYYNYGDRIVKIYVNNLDRHLWILGRLVYSKKDVDKLFNEVVKSNFKMILEA